MTTCAQINGIKIAFTDEGQGLPVVFLHGFPLNRTMWTPQVERLATRFRVITIDLRGHGESEAPLWHYSMEQFADDLIGVLDHLAIEQAALVGLSMGGYVLFSCVRRYPHRIKALIFCDTRAGADTLEGRAARFSMAQIAYRRGAGAIADLMLPKLLAPSTSTTNPSLVDRVRAMISRTEISGIAGDLMAMAARPDSTEMLETIRVPTLVIAGEQDAASPPAEVKKIADGIPGAQFVTIPEAGHLPNLEQPERFNTLLEKFLAER
jgi:3-oxoadipate enol-lactonase